MLVDISVVFPVIFLIIYFSLVSSCLFYIGREGRDFMKIGAINRMDWHLDN